jgi:hypothetical protein
VPIVPFADDHRDSIVRMCAGGGWAAVSADLLALEGAETLYASFGRRRSGGLRVYPDAPA